MEVRVLAARPSSAYPEQDYICVHTDADPLDDTVVLATIGPAMDRRRVHRRCVNGVRRRGLDRRARLKARSTRPTC